jgi:hypothetical protein
MSTNKTIDYLFEDPPVTGQNYALISIVGPHMPQKCDVWGLKIRGVVNTLDQAKSQTQKLMTIDNNYDIYTVEVGKFFPLAVEPLEIQNVEYQNTQLNNLIKGYLENRQAANEQWMERKNEMVQDAIREGREQTGSSIEHPIAVLQAIQTTRDKMSQLIEEVEKSKNELLDKMYKFNTYELDERESAIKELSKAFENVDKENDKNEFDMLKQELDSQFKFPVVKSNSLNHVLEEISVLEDKLALLTTGEESNENKQEIEKLKQELEYRKKELNDRSHASDVNEFINSNYKDSPYNNL